ncbi:5-oxoprolinase subunit C family protein [Corynebacterium epidermidicanis]|uniref:Biotin-dependent carboxylase-like protein n=1 Tax=Corynebacterium epidermidicanis TaxID=1050174 RepID=A0A0G3GTA7_9CORY|nr:biotin-dependent carboxyltransferase family protein [Corynebacterium epidermidicanis]AKK02763.1 biotin-dependent carboxylase-like protein [Corynebacterium epidermidicanis]
MIRVIQTGPQALLQDAGRFGLAGTGVAPSGVFDRMSAVRANHALGNDPFAPVIEILMGSFEFEALNDAHIILTGMGAPFTITRPDGTQRMGYSNEIVDIVAGERVFIKMARTGLRGYLGIRGGFAAFQVLGSCSTDVMSNIGPAPLAPGDEIPTGNAIAEVAWWPALRNLPTLWKETKVHTLSVVPGPRQGWFDEQSQQDFFNQTFTVNAASNRIGVRLDAEIPLRRLDATRELPSEGMVRGSIQVPPDGNPVIFGPDYPVTGGYPVIGVLTRRSSDHSAQLAPGDSIRFTTLSSAPHR